MGNNMSDNMNDKVNYGVNDDVNYEKKRIRIYLSWVLGVCFFLGAAAYFTRDSREGIAYQILQKGFTAFPVLAAVLTRRMTGDDTKWRFSLKVWKKPSLWFFCAFIPGILIVIGAALYFVLFPEQYSGSFDLGGLLGMNGAMPVRSPLLFAAVCVLASASCIPVQLLELGEEIGWRGYLLPKQIAEHGMRKGVLLNGFFWGMAHMPLIFLGFNYSAGNPGAPWSNMLMMLAACMTLGIICSCVMVHSGNVMYCAIIHGAVNIIGEIPVFLSVTRESGLLGPNPTGLIGLSGLMACAGFMFVRQLPPAEGRLRNRH